MLIPSSIYVLVKRFSAKEETRRITAALYDPEQFKTEQIGFENHINYFHNSGQGLSKNLAKGLVLFLNSTIADAYFRQFSGHTQVNATDLRNLKYPSRAQLEALGAKIDNVFPSQDETDKLVEEGVFKMPGEKTVSNPAKAGKKVAAALEILKLLALPREQLNERSALTLLALADLKPSTPCSKATDKPRGITEMMNYFSANYGKTYAPNTRETVRRFSVHQFLQAGIVLINPDDTTRPTNSPKSVYKLAPAALELLRSFGTDQWERNLKSYLSEKGTLAQKYAREREMEKIPVTTQDGTVIHLTPGGQLIYIGDTGDKWEHFDKKTLSSLGVEVEEHGKMPDVVIYHVKENWLLLIEAVTSHGPMDAKRRTELELLFKKSKAGLVYVTAFPTRKIMVRYLSAISWETEVWVADSPTHMIHFNGERFLGPY